jgi:UDP-glucose 4-epimerase
MRVLITGGCGFIGSNLVHKLVESDPSVQLRVFDNESLGKRAHLDNYQGEFIRGDLRDAEALSDALADVDAVVHLAADTRVINSIEDPVHNFEVNVRGTLNLLEGMRARGVRRLINASTGGAILGDVTPPVHEEMLPRPASPYGAAKLAVEGYCSAFGASYGIRSLSLRFSNVYGPRSYHKGSVVAEFLKRVAADETVVVYGDGSQIRDYVFVEDLCGGIVSALSSDATGAIQLASGRPVTISALLETIGEVVAPAPLRVEHRPFRDGEVRATFCDIGKARRELGYEPVTPLHEGLIRTWAWFQAYGATSREPCPAMAPPAPRATLAQALPT